MAATRHTNYNRPRRDCTTTSRSVSESAATKADPQIGEAPKRYVYAKSNTTPIRIRKGPGFTYDHNGKYIGTQKKVEICEIDNAWGLLADYEETRDGWICLEFLDAPTE